MKNDTASGPAGWVNVPVFAEHGCEAIESCNPDSETDAWIRKHHCYGNARRCTQADSKRGFRGTSDSGPLRLVFRNMYKCVIWIGEGTYGDGDKPITLANWDTDIVFKVNGKDCVRPNCRVSAGETSSYAYAQVVQIDAKAVLGKSCRRGDVEVSMEVKPGSPTSHTCAIRDGYCRVSGDFWHARFRNDLCDEKDTDKKEGEACGTVPRYQNASNIETYVSYAISF